MDEIGELKAILKELAPKIKALEEELRPLQAKYAFNWNRLKDLEVKQHEAQGRIKKYGPSASGKARVTIGEQSFTVAELLKRVEELKKKGGEDNE